LVHLCQEKPVFNQHSSIYRYCWYQYFIIKALTLFPV